MRQILFRIVWDSPWMLWGIEARSGDDAVGAAVLITLVSLGFAVAQLSQADGRRTRLIRNAILWFSSVLTLTILSSLPAVRDWMETWPLRIYAPPLYGYGLMVMLGFLAGLWWAQQRARSAGLDPHSILDVGFWLLLSSMVGGRLEYLRQYRVETYHGASGFGEYFIRTIDLSQGGLVLFGALIGGTLGVILYARFKKVSPWPLLDVLIPSAFLGIGFGRIGCLLNGCCFGDPCQLPWGVEFPAGSVPYDSLVQRGFLLEGAPATMPLHPTQIYSSIDGFLLTAVTGMYFPLRRWNGEVLTIGALCYSITRFLIEFLRWDEMGQLATTITISQFYSLIVFCVALGVFVVQSIRVRGQPGIGTGSSVAVLQPVRSASTT